MIVVAGGNDGTPTPAADTSTTLNIVPPVAPLPGVPVAEPIINTDSGPAIAVQPQVATPPVKVIVVTPPVVAPVVVPPVVVPPVVDPPVVVPPVVSPPKANPFPIEQVKPGVISPQPNPFPAGGGPKPQPQQPPASPGGVGTGGSSVGP